MTRSGLFLLAALAAMPVWAGEVVVLSTGFRLAADRHETVGDKVVIHTREGTLEFAASAVAGYQQEEALPETPPPTVPAILPEEAKPVDARQLVTSAALQYGLPPELVHGIARVESNYNPKAVSPKGARGIMQLMPATADKLAADAGDPKQNVEAGARYLQELLIRYENDPEPVRRALAAYNAGPGAVARYKGVPPYPETQLYVEKVLQQYWKQMKK